MLNYKVFGHASEKPPVLIAHGLFGSLSNWTAIAKKLAVEGHQIFVVDMRNHGESFWDEEHDYVCMAEDLKTIAESINGRVNIIGHSMGGKAAMVMALEYPHLISNLIVVDIAPFSYVHNQSHYLSALEGIDLSSVTKRSDGDKALEEFIADKMVRAFLLQNLVVDKEKKNRWRINIPALKDNMLTLSGFPTKECIFKGRTLFVKGDRSDYITHESNVSIQNLFPNAVFKTIPAAGHWVHADAPDDFLTVIMDFI